MKLLDELLKQAQISGTSELLLTTGDSPAVRMSRAWVRLGYPKCTASEVEQMARAILSADGWDELQRKRTVECEMAIDGAMGTRCTIDFERGSLTILVSMMGAGV